VQRNKEVSKLIEKWRPKLFLGEWFITVNYAREDLPRDEQGSTLAEVSADPVYMNAAILIYPEWFRRDKGDREHAIVHELCHLVTEELYGHVRALREGSLITEKHSSESLERLTQRIANIAYRPIWEKK
jgi:hypothetical protein